MATDDRGFPIPEEWEKHDKSWNRYLKLHFGAAAVYYNWTPKGGATYTIHMPIGEDQLEYAVEIVLTARAVREVEITTFVGDDMDSYSSVRHLGDAAWHGKQMLEDVYEGVRMRRLHGIPRKNERPRDREVPGDGASGS